MDFKNTLGQAYKLLTRTSRMQDELYWAQIYNNTVSGSTWLKDNSFCLGRWAVGYPFLYALYRVLNEWKPKRILELGLGQTTKMIGQYAANNQEIEHIIIEQDKDWIEFFTKGVFSLPQNSNIIQHDYEFIPYKSQKDVRVFSDFANQINNKSFDLICIDAPIGSKVYSRIDILKLLPACLPNSFVLMMDDYNRIGEQNTIKDIKSCLDNNKINYST